MTVSKLQRLLSWAIPGVVVGEAALIVNGYGATGGMRPVFQVQPGSALDGGWWIGLAVLLFITSMAGWIMMLVELVFWRVNTSDYPVWRWIAVGALSTFLASAAMYLSYRVIAYSPGRNEFAVVSGLTFLAMRLFVLSLFSRKILFGNLLAVTVETIVAVAIWASIGPSVIDSMVQFAR